jgi:hypothetical protein
MQKGQPTSDEWQLTLTMRASMSSKKIQKKPVISKLLCFAKAKMQDEDRDDNGLAGSMFWKALEDIDFGGYSGLTLANLQHQDFESEVERIYPLQSFLNRKCRHPALGGLGAQTMTAIIITTATLLDEKEPRIEAFFA